MDDADAVRNEPSAKKASVAALEVNKDCGCCLRLQIALHTSEAARVRAEGQLDAQLRLDRNFNKLHIAYAKAQEEIAALRSQVVASNNLQQERAQLLRQLEEATRLRLTAEKDCADVKMALSRAQAQLAMEQVGLSPAKTGDQLVLPDEFEEDDEDVLMLDAQEKEVEKEHAQAQQQQQQQGQAQQQQQQQQAQQQQQNEQHEQDADDDEDNMFVEATEEREQRNKRVREEEELAEKQHQIPEQDEGEVLVLGTNAPVASNDDNNINDNNNNINIDDDDALNNNGADAHLNSNPAAMDAELCKTQAVVDTGAGPNRPIIMLSGFGNNTALRMRVERRIQALGGQLYSGKAFSSTITHVVYPESSPSTIKLVAAVLLRIWIVSDAWISASSDAGHFLPETSCGGQRQDPSTPSPLLGKTFSFHASFDHKHKHAQQLIETGGGSISTDDEGRADFRLVGRDFPNPRPNDLSWPRFLALVAGPVKLKTATSPPPSAKKMRKRMKLNLSEGNN